MAIDKEVNPPGDRVATGLFISRDPP